MLKVPFRDIPVPVPAALRDVVLIVLFPEPVAVMEVAEELPEMVNKPE